MFLVENEILSYMLADRLFISDILMTNLIWKFLIKSLGMMCTKNKQTKKTTHCVCLCVQNRGAHFLVKDKAGYLSSADHSHIPTRVYYLDGLDYKCRTSNEEFHKSSNEWYPSKD